MILMVIVMMVLMKVICFCFFFYRSSLVVVGGLNCGCNDDLYVYMIYSLSGYICIKILFLNPSLCN